MVDLSNLAEKYGVDLSKFAPIRPAAEVKAEKAEESRTSIDAGTLLLQSLHSAHQLSLLVCKGCSRSFQSNYCREWYCSDACMKKAFLQHFNVEWDTLKPGNQDFRKEASKVVGPDTTEALYEWCRAFVDAYESPSQIDQQRGLQPGRSGTSLVEMESDLDQTDYMSGQETSEDVHPPTARESEERYLEANPLPEPGSSIDPFAGLF